MTEAILETRSLTRRFGGGSWSHSEPLVAVNNVSLHIRADEVLAIVGASGSGKSTLFRMLLGLLGPSDGEVLFEGRPIAQVPKAQFARVVQPVFQNPFSSLNPRLTIGTSIERPLLVHGSVSRGARPAAVRRIMDRVGLPEAFLSRYPNQLSGGQLQRVAIARALVLEPVLLLCDEPTSALDVSVQAQILNLLLDLRHELSLGIAIVTHDLSVVRHLADRIIVMNRGAIVESGPTTDVLERPADPYTRSLLAAELRVPFDTPRPRPVGMKAVS